MYGPKSNLQTIAHSLSPISPWGLGHIDCAGFSKSQPHSTDVFVINIGPFLQAPVRHQHHICISHPRPRILNRFAEIRDSNRIFALVEERTVVGCHRYNSESMASCVDERNNFIWTLLLHTKPMEAENQIKRKMNAKSGDTVAKASVAAKPRHRCTCSWFAFQARTPPMGEILNW